ncbi:hypothetical protein LDVICp148 [lymphocystis disease virus-China]|uniref:Thioredoxin domain-containing protein n=2 Tax=Lymphocystis disease virus 2 TaxID=159183 RepID=A0A6F8X2P1_9VIRU|nr:hypothetical protein LDVICp148 [lymphocystis disease virus-China]AAU10993.1 hypothetical protein [lymphocystis disease virus-China]BCB67499.1 hypothetical protein [Lymphocystis disease virus 2]
MDNFTYPISYAIISDFTEEGLLHLNLRPCLLVIGSNSCTYCLKLVPEIHKLIEPLDTLGVRIIIAQPFDGESEAEKAVIKKLPKLLKSKTINLPTLVFIDISGKTNIWEGYEISSKILKNIKLAL